MFIVVDLKFQNCICTAGGQAACTKMECPQSMLFICNNNKTDHEMQLNNFILIIYTKIIFTIPQNKMSTQFIDNKISTESEPISTHYTEIKNYYTNKYPINLDYGSNTPRNSKNYPN